MTKYWEVSPEHSELEHLEYFLCQIKKADALLDISFFEITRHVERFSRLRKGDVEDLVLRGSPLVLFLAAADFSFAVTRHHCSRRHAWICEHRRNGRKAKEGEESEKLKNSVGSRMTPSNGERCADLIWHDMFTLYRVCSQRRLTCSVNAEVAARFATEGKTDITSSLVVVLYIGILCSRRIHSFRPFLSTLHSLKDRMWFCYIPPEIRKSKIPRSSTERRRYCWTILVH